MRRSSLARPSRSVLRQDSGDLQLGLVGDAGHLLLDEQRVLVLAPGAGLLDSPPCPAHQGRQGRHAQAQEDRLPGLPVPYPEVCLQHRQGQQRQNRHGRCVGAVYPALGGGGGRVGIVSGPGVGLLLIAPGPLRPQGKQPQPGHHPLPLLQVGQGADDGDEGVGAPVQQVVVPEGAHGQVLWSPEQQVHGPRLLPPSQPQGVFFQGDIVHPGLGVVNAQLLADEGALPAPDQQGDPARVPGDLQREGFGDGDGAQQVLHAQHGTLPRAGRRDGAISRVAGSFRPLNILAMKFGLM